MSCARAACGRVFQLCRYCDRGHRYCDPACAAAARRASCLDAGRRYQASHDGRRAHADRQRRYRERLRQKVTHQRREVEASAVMVRTSPVTDAKVAPASTGLEVSRHVTHHPGPTAGPIRCAACGRQGRFLRHDTLARVGRPEHHRRFRALP